MGTWLNGEKSKSKYTSGFFHLDRTLLVIRLSRDRAVGINAEFVNQLGLVEEGHKYVAFLGLAATVQIDRQDDSAATGADLDFLKVFDAHAFGVIRMHFANRSRVGPFYFRNTTGHRTGVPVFQHTTGTEPEGILLVR